LRTQADARKKRTFKKFSFRGKDLEGLLQLSPDETMDLLCSRARRKYRRGTAAAEVRFLKKLRKAKAAAVEVDGVLEKPATVKTHMRNMTIIPEMVGSVCGVYSGKHFVTVEIKVSMETERGVATLAGRLPSGLASAASLPRTWCTTARRSHGGFSRVVGMWLRLQWATWVCCVHRCCPSVRSRLRVWRQQRVLGLRVDSFRHHHASLVCSALQPRPHRLCALHSACCCCCRSSAQPGMIGMYLAEFSITYKPVSHGRPGIGATNSSRFIPLK
jgi:small subunit ribosomal protein S15e